jgi:hypothetical protein
MAGEGFWNDFSASWFPRSTPHARRRGTSENGMFPQEVRRGCSVTRNAFRRGRRGALVPRGVMDPGIAFVPSRAVMRQALPR